MQVRRTIQILALLGLGACTPLWPQPAAPTPSAIRILLVGDSTVALHNGWGPGFCALAAPNVACLDLGKNGRSSASYRAEGSWDRVMTELKSVPAGHTTYVLVQFGHNDQPGKPGRSTDLVTEFPANMRRYVQDVKSAGAKPVLITPLTRRSFKNGKLKNDLAAWADATRRVAQEESVPCLELNAESWVAVQKMGGVEANTLAMAPPPASFAASAAAGNSLPAPKPPPKQEASGVSKPSTPVAVFDYTHLGKKGSAYFGRMVAHELTTAIPGLAPYFTVQFGQP